MITSHLMFVAEVFGRSRRVLRSNGSEGRPGSGLPNLLTAAINRLRQHSPPLPLSNHLRQDIGLDPVSVRNDWQWHR